MTEFEYEREVYNRNFLNCSQRQGIVALESFGCKTANLFYNAQISTDIIREQIFLQQTPRYDFIYDGLMIRDYAMIGIKYSEIKYSSFEEAIPKLLEVIDRDSFVLISCDVFLVPHRPEFYYKKHINHFVTLLSYDAENEEWQAIDDVSSGHLAKFIFTSEYLSKICNAAKEKVFRVFEKLPTENGEARNSSVDFLFANSRINRSDNFRILEDIVTMENSKTSVEGMANVFSIILGSRICFAKFLQQKPVFSEAEKLSNRIAVEARTVRNLLNIYATIGSFKHEGISSKVENIVVMEKKLSSLLER
ncbi:hypothetical protein [Xenorhabdus taiwanensis]|uniref:Butirosin biosynthesis protein H N-terminal domain-containing protein n=1 Tax=Xenorhabdus taiwanensis TaxID=3085177 RepID=A0ABN7C8F2_9GAMM|nr:hypothetical protein TCT1_37840 [Xenorhabdus sp. TCT-1]